MHNILNNEFNLNYNTQQDSTMEYGMHKHIKLL